MQSFAEDLEFRRSVGALIPHVDPTAGWLGSVRVEAPSFQQIEKEFEESLGYIRNDIRWLCDRNSGLNYTTMFLITCGCEVLAAAEGLGKRYHSVFAELLPDGDWRALSKPLFDALRNGLAHSFDTKSLNTPDGPVQIFISWSMSNELELRPNGLYVGVQPLARRLCGKIDRFREKLRTDEAARQRFAVAPHAQAQFSPTERLAWGRLNASQNRLR